MALTQIDPGAAPNNGLGTTLRAAAAIINAIITEMWDTVTGGIAYLAGRVGIGTSTNLNAKLTVEDNQTTTADFQALELRTQNSTRTAGDSVYQSFTMHDSAGADREFARLTSEISDPASNGSGKMIFSVLNAGVLGTKGAIDEDGNLGVGTVNPTEKVDIVSDVIRLRTAKTPASAGATGNAGSIAWDATYFYICVATDTWERVQHDSW